MSEPLLKFHCFCGGFHQLSPTFAGRLVLCQGCADYVLVPRLAEEQPKYPKLTRLTPRLEIRLAIRRDWREVHAIQGDAENYHFEIAEPESPRGTRRRIRAGRFPAGFKKSNQLLFVARCRATGTLVGLLPISFTIPYYSVNLGIVIHHPHAGRGYGLESVRSVAEMLFAEMGVRKVNAMCDLLNLRCIKMLESAGFVREGVARAFFLHPRRGWLDSPYYALFNPADEN